MSQLIHSVDDLSFEEKVLNSNTPVLVDFWAEWCNPCRIIAPILVEVAHVYAGKLTILKLNVDENKTIPAKYSVRGIPTLMLFKQGQVQNTKVGALSKTQLTEFLDCHL